jgi:cytoskeleton protein RodZ
VRFGEGQVVEEGSDRKLRFTVVGDDPTAAADPPAKSDSTKSDSGESDSGELESQLVYLAETERRALGATLREAREHRKMTLREAAEALRIRYVYLEAIETGRFNDLPGGVYASGFLRSYANYLDLDAEEVLRRFKACGSGFDAKTELAFPVPLPESRIPKGAIVLASLLAAAMIYGIWYSLSRPDPATERVPEVPERLTTTAPGEDAATASGPQESPDTESAPETVAATADEAAVVETTADEATADEATVVETTADEAAADEAAPEVAVAPAPVVAAEPPPLVESPPATPAPAAEPPAPVAGAEARPQGQVAEPGAPSRILLRATKDVWVHIGDPRSGEVFFNRTLKSGESFQVPGGKELTLMTGNAGALEVLVDGERAPRLGPAGAIRRLVTLEAGRLRMGTAVVR